MQLDCGINGLVLIEPMHVAESAVIRTVTTKGKFTFPVSGRDSFDAESIFSHFDIPKHKRTTYTEL